MRIKHCSEEEAERMCDGTSVRWVSSKRRFLGSGGAVLTSDSDSCKVLTPDPWQWQAL